MSAGLLLQQVDTFDVAVAVAVFAIACSRKMYRKLPSFFILLAVSTFHQLVCIPLIFFRPTLGVPKWIAYMVIWNTEWAGQLIEGTLTVIAVYAIFQKLMKPLVGLQRLGRIVFRWVGGISLAMALLVTLTPHADGRVFFANQIALCIEAISILILCLLLFVTFATRPLGLTYRSHLFGITLGLGVGATASLVQSVWLPTRLAGSFYSPVFLITGFGFLLTSTIWGIYLTRPEPARCMVLLPTTSPFLTWNRVAEALGDAPGEVAVGGISPEMFSPAELLAFRAPARVVEIPQAAQR